MSTQQEQEPKPADADVGWLDLKASEGDAYRVKAVNYNIAETPEAEANAAQASGPSFEDVAVLWSNGTSGAPSQDVQNQTAITWYKLEKTPWYNLVFSYQLTINASDTYNYYFKDATGDKYNLNVFVSSGGSHYVQFNSDNPTIKSISGS